MVFNTELTCINISKFYKVEKSVLRFARLTYGHPYSNHNFLFSPVNLYRKFWLFNAIIFSIQLGKSFGFEKPVLKD